MHNYARLLAAAPPHSGIWLVVLSISSNELRLNGNVIKVIICFRFDANLCSLHVRFWGTFVDSRGTLELFYKRFSS